MPVFKNNARTKADRIAAVVGLAAFGAGITLIVIGVQAPDAPLPAPTTTTVSTAAPTEPTTTTTEGTMSPWRSGYPVRTYEEVSTTDGAPGTSVVTVTTSPAAVSAGPWLGSRAADLTFQVMLVTLAALLLAYGTRRVLLGEYAGSGGGASVAPIVGATAAVTEEEAAAVKKDVAAAREAPDLSRPLFEKAPVTDPRMRLLQNRITLELDVRKLAQDHDLPSGLTMPFVVKGLVDAKKMSPKLGASVVALSEIGERLGHGADISLDTTTLLSDAYSQALAKVGGKIR